MAAAGVGYCLRRLRRESSANAVPLVGVMAAALFAAQMVNLPLFVAPTSGHLVGGVLAAVVLGPWAGTVAIVAVLSVQCLLFADGGVTALGANAINMGLVGTWAGYAVFDAIRRLLPGRRGTVAAAVVASWVVTPVGAVACSVEMAAGGTVAFGPVVTAMLFYHVFIGVIEATITGLVVGLDHSHRTCP